MSKIWFSSKGQFVYTHIYITLNIGEDLSCLVPFWQQNAWEPAVLLLMILKASILYSAINLTPQYDSLNYHMAFDRLVYKNFPVIYDLPLWFHLID